MAEPKQKRLTHAEKKELVRMMKEDRQSGRCKIAKRLYEEASILTKEIDEAISRLEIVAKTTLTEIRRLREEKRKMISEAKLTVTNSYEYNSCSSENVYPELAEYDMETRRL